MKKTLAAGFLAYLLLSLAVGFLGTAVTPVSALADGSGPEPPRASDPPDTTVTSSDDFNSKAVISSGTLSVLDYATMALQVIL